MPYSRKIRTLCPAIGFFLACFATSANAENKEKTFNLDEVDIVSRITVGQMRADLTTFSFPLFEQVITVEAPEVSTPSLGIGATFFFENMFVDLYGTTATDKDAVYNIQPLIQTGIDVNRKDMQFTLGYSLIPSVSMFAGYRYSDFGAEGTSLQEFEVSTKHNGPFIGATYAKLLSETGALLLSVGYASINGNFNVTPPSTTDLISIFGPIQSVEVNQQFRVDADTKGTGLSYGIEWAHAHDNTIGYSIKLSGHRYEFDSVVRSDGFNIGTYTDQFMMLSFNVSKQL